MFALDVRDASQKSTHKDVCVCLSLWLNHAFTKIEELVCTAKHLLPPQQVMLGQHINTIYTLNSINHRDSTIGFF